MEAAVRIRRAERRRWHKGEPQYLREHHQHMADAHYAVEKARRAGLLKPWPRCAVPDCNQRYVHAHHPSYAPDMWLHVVWLCRRCHHQLHVEHRVSNGFTNGTSKKRKPLIAIGGPAIAYRGGSPVNVNHPRESP